MDWLFKFVKSDTRYSPNAMTDIEVEKETKYKVDSKGETERNLEDAGDKMQAGAKALGKKIEDPDRDLGSEYEKEKFKERTNTD
jgi:hypothetical protein